MKKKELPKIESIKVNLIMNIILKISAFIFPLITFPYVSRVIGVVGNGKISFIFSFIGYFSMFSQLGIPTYGIRACAICRDDEEKLSKTVQELMIINTIMMVIVYISFVITLKSIPKFQADKGLYIIASSTILLNGIGMEWLFQGLEQYRYITYRNLFFKILSIILMFIFVKNKSDYIIYGAITVVGTCGSNILNFFYAKRILQFKKFKHYELKKHLKPIINFFMLTIAVSVYTSIDTIMLGFISGDAEVGYYTAATKMKMILVSAVTALGTVLLPRMSNYLSNGNKLEYDSLIKKSFMITIIGTTALTAYFIVMADCTIGFLAGKDYMMAVYPMQIISLTVFIIGLSNITGMQILVPSNREKYTTYSTFVGAIVNLTINIILIPKLGSIGAAIGTVIAEIIVLIFQFIVIRKELKPIIKSLRVFKIIFANIVSLIILILLKNTLKIYNDFIILCITSVVFFGTYTFILLISKEEFTLFYYKKFVLRRIRQENK